MSTQPEIELLLTATQPVSHQDAGTDDTGNTLTFNRRKQLIARLELDPATPMEIDAFCAAHPVPVEVWDALQHVSYPEFVAATLVTQMIDIYNSKDGAGLFRGVARYEMLERKLTSAAIVSSTLGRLWTALCNALLLPIHDTRDDAALMQLWGLSPAVQAAAVTVCVEQARSIVSIARFWSQQTKLRSEKYAAAAGQSDMLGAPMCIAKWKDAQVPTTTTMVADVPTVSGNGVRHQAVRAPAWAHLTRSLGIDPGYAGQGSLPLAVESIFSNGGNIRAGAKQPTNSFALAGRIRQTFPALDLLGGVTDSFDLGESALKVSTWLVCRENQTGLPAYLAAQPEAQISAFDMLDQITETRQATPNGVGQMIRSFEVLVPGTQVYVRCSLGAWTQPLTRGALVTALAEYRHALSVLGGQSARGYGQMRVDEIFGFPTAYDDAELYEEYLATHKDQLATWMLDGTLGSGVVVCS